MKRLNSIINASLGNILEWYDFGLFAIFSSLFSKLFFPANVPHLALMSTLAIFSVGFIFRPIGALLFGYMGDRLGRVKTLRFSILMISLPTFLIAFLPTYQQVGMLSPILLIITRMLQGISIGGEYSGSLIYLAESAPDNHRAFVTSFASMGANLGILMAAIVGFICGLEFTDTLLQGIGWRLAYLFGGIVSLLILFFRLRIEETQVFTHLKEKKQLTANPIRTVFQKNLHDLCRTLGLVCMGSTFYYFCFVYIPIFLSNKKGISIDMVSILMSILLVLMIIVTPIGGMLCDRIGRRKMFLFNATLISLIILPGFYFLQLNEFIIITLVLAFFAIGSALEQSTTPITIIENFPAQARYTGISLSYNIGNGLLGGTVPIVCEWLISATNSTMAPAIYITLCALVTGFVALYYVPETREKAID